MIRISRRSIPDDVKKTVKKEAERKSVSLKRAMKQTAGGRASNKKKKALYHDLDHFAGLWSREEAAVFEKSLKNQRKDRCPL